MKKLILATLLVSSVLSGCETKTESVTEVVQETKEEPKKSLEESYAPLFDDLRLMKENYVQNQKYNVLTEKTVWFSKDRDIYYAPYDINNDGIDELFLANKYEGDLQQIGVYYLNDGKVERLGDRLDPGYSFLNFDGLVVVYKDGTLYTTNSSVPTGKGAEYIYKLAPNGTSLEVIAQNIFENVMKDKHLIKDYNLDSVEKLDIKNLDWKKFEYKK